MIFPWAQLFFSYTQQFFGSCIIKRMVFLYNPALPFKCCSSQELCLIWLCLEISSRWQCLITSHSVFTSWPSQDFYLVNVFNMYFLFNLDWKKAENTVRMLIAMLLKLNLCSTFFLSPPLSLQIPLCKVIRFNIDYTIHFIEEMMPEVSYESDYSRHLFALWCVKIF